VRVYLSAQWARRAEMQGYEVRLRERGFVVVSRWHQGEPMGNDEAPTLASWREWGLADLSAIGWADVFVAFMEPPGTHSRGGRHVEWGYALARERAAEMTTATVGECESQFYALTECRARDFDELILLLEGLE